MVRRLFRRQKPFCKHRRALLRVESLESRQLLAVDLRQALTAFNAGNLTIVQNYAQAMADKAFGTDLPLVEQTLSEALQAGSARLGSSLQSIHDALAPYGINFKITNLNTAAQDLWSIIHGQPVDIVSFAVDGPRNGGTLNNEQTIR
jgi:hypothetical protein